MVFIRVEPDFDVSRIDAYRPIDAFDIPFDEYEHGIPHGYDLELQRYLYLEGVDPLFYGAHSAMLDFGRGDLFPQVESELEHEGYAGAIVDGSGDHPITDYVWESDWEDD